MLFASPPPPAGAVCSPSDWQSLFQLRRVGQQDKALSPLRGAEQTRVVPWRGTPVGLGCSDHPAGRRVLLLLSSGLQGGVSPAQASCSLQELFPAHPPAKPGNSRGSGSGAGPGALSTPFFARAFPRGSRLLGREEAQIPPFHQMASVLAEGKPPACQTGVTKRLQQNHNNPKTLFQ